MKKTKKLLSMALATVMALTPMTVFADTATTGGAVGSGEVEGYIEKSVFSVTLPTDSSTQDTFDFILDPQDLIKDTSNAKYAGATFTGTTGVYFETSANTYSEDSADVTIEVKASMNTKVTVDANVSITSGEGVTFVDNTAALAATDGALTVYLALEDSATTAAVDADGSATIAGDVAALSDSSFELTYANGEYSYGLTSAASTATGNQYKFHMTGACNKNSDWSDVTDLKVTTDVVWNVTKADEAAAIEVYAAVVGSTIYVGSDNTTPEPAKFAEGTTFTNVMLTFPDGSTMDVTSMISTDTGWLSLGGASTRGTYTITFDANGTSYTSTFTY